MQIPDLNLERTFFCHSHAPQFGFWGELRQMARQDMSLREAVKFHAKKWEFSGEIADLLATENETQFKYFAHDFSHIILMISTVYNTNLKSLLPTVDQEGNLKPIGYNGFANGEELVINFQRVLIALHDGIISPKEAEDRYYSEIDHAQEYILVQDTIDWAKSFLAFRHNNENLFEYKMRMNFDSKAKISKTVSFLEVLRSIKSRSDNIHPDIILETQKLPILMFEAFWQQANIIITTLFDKFKKNTNFEKNLGDIKIRNLHVLIGGEASAHAYFAQCGIPDYKKAAELTAAP